MNRRKLSWSEGWWKDEIIRSGKSLALDGFYVDNEIETAPAEGIDVYKHKPIMHRGYSFEEFRSLYGEKL